MESDFFQWFSWDEIVVFFVSMVPFLEVQVALPLAVGAYQFSAEKAFWIVLIGNSLPLVILLPLCERLMRFLARRFTWIDQHVHQKLQQLRSDHQRSYDRFGVIVLWFFRAIPLPGTGMWSASLLAQALLIPKWKACLAILCGNIVASIIVLLASQGVFEHLWPYLKSLL